MIRATAAMLFGLALASPLASPAAAQDIAYEVDGMPVEGYFAKAAEPRGLVVIVHDWDGLGDYERQRADMLAAAGYDAFAIDVYGAGVRPADTDGRMAAMKAAFSDPARLGALVQGGIAKGQELSTTEASVLIGYCFGGAVTLAAARAGAPEGVVGFATFHATLPAGDAPWPADTPPLLIMHGGADKNPTLAAMADYIAPIETAGVPYELQVYSGAPHAFTVFGSENYREVADGRSWTELQRFLADRFAGENG